MFDHMAEYREWIVCNDGSMTTAMPKNTRKIVTPSLCPTLNQSTNLRKLIRNPGNEGGFHPPILPLTRAVIRPRADMVMPAEL